MSEEKPGREDGRGRPSAPDSVADDGGLSDEQIDREAPGVEDATELEAAEAELAEEAEDDEDKVVATPTRRRQRAGSRPAGRAADPAPTGEATRSRAAAERARAAELRDKRSIGRFLREVVAELRKVIWPGRKELITYTTVVIVFVAVMVALVAGLDIAFAKGVVAVFG